MRTARVSLGFTEGSFPPGVHVCHIFSDDLERDRALHLFLLEGIRTGERCACFSDHVTVEHLRQQLAATGASPAGLEDSVTISPTAQAYFAGGRFQIEPMLRWLETFYRETMQSGRPGARVIGEMTREIESVPDGSLLVNYEARVTRLLRDQPMCVVCQYDARTFDGSALMDVLRVHPYVVVRGAIVHNPFFLSPEKVLQSVNAA